MASTYTPNFHLAEFIGTTAVYDSIDEFRRWTTVDTNLKVYADLLGAGVIYGWNLTVGNGLYLNVSPGAGLVDSDSKYAAETIIVGTALVPPSVTDYYVVAQKRSDTYYTGNIDFQAYDVVPTDAIILGKVTSGSSTITTVVDEPRTIIGYSEELAARLEAILNSHKHDGVESPKINLSTMVEGLLPAANIIGDIPFSKITGNFSGSIVGSISHKGINDIGNYNHEQIDTFLDTMIDPVTQLVGSYESFGEILLTNHIQNTLTLSHALGQDVQTYYVNERSVIPGITGSWVATCLDIHPLHSAIIDTVNHKWVGTTAVEIPVQYKNLTLNSDDTSDYYILKTDAAYRTATYENLERFLNPIDNTYEIRLKAIASFPQYVNEGSAEFVFNSNTSGITNWKDLKHFINIPKCASITIYGKTAADLDSLDNSSNEYMQLAAKIPWSTDHTTFTASTMTNVLVPLSSNQYLKIKYNFYTASTTRTPAIATMAANYNANQEDSYEFTYYDSKSDWYRGIPTIPDGITLEDIPGAISLKNQDTYKQTGWFTSTYIDGNPSLVAWGFLYTDVIIPPKTTVSWQGRTGTSIAYLETFEPAYSTINQVAPDSGMYDLSPFRYQFLQVKGNLTREADASIKTPELLGMYVTNYCENPTNIGTCIEYKRWTMDSSGINGFYNTSSSDTNITWYANSNNISTKSIIGGLTSLDPAAGNSYFSSAAYKPILLPNEQHEWKTLKMYGENFHTENVKISIYMDSNPELSNLAVATYTATGSPFIIDLSPFDLVKKQGYLWYKLEFLT